MSVETTPLGSRAQRWSAQLGQIAAIVAVVFLAKGRLRRAVLRALRFDGADAPESAMRCWRRNFLMATAPLRCQSTSNVPASGRIFGATPKRGDVVVFRWPGDRSQVWVKRVIGLPGDHVQVRQGVVWINVASPPRSSRMASAKRKKIDNGAGEARSTNYIETLPGGISHEIFKLYDNGRLDNTPEVVVPPDRLFVMGDNRDNSADSRVSVREGGVGLLPMDNLVGRVDAIVGSWDLGIRNRPMTSWLEGFRVSRFFTSVH